MTKAKAFLENNPKLKPFELAEILDVIPTISTENDYLEARDIYTLEDGSKIEITSHSAEVLDD